MKRNIPITENMRGFVAKYNPNYQKIVSVIKNKCSGLSSEAATVSCMQKNGLPQSDVNFYVGASRAFVFIDSPQDPGRVPNIQVASVSCIGLIK
jgi:hypothetical protein